jgi:ketosteroid isomerase-like protein
MTLVTIVSRISMVGGRAHCYFWRHRYWSAYRELLKLMTKQLLSCLLLGLCSLAQSAGPKADSPEAQLLALERMWNQAQLLRDSDALQALIADRFINTEWDGEVSDRGKFLADIRDPKFQPDTMSIQEVKVAIYGNTAVVTGNYHTKGLYSGKPYEHVGRFTDTWIREEERWLCVASHTSLLKKTGSAP